MIPLDLLHIFTVNLTSKTRSLDHSNVLLPPFSVFHQWFQSRQAISCFVCPKFNPQMLCAHLFLAAVRCLVGVFVLESQERLPAKRKSVQNGSDRQNNFMFHYILYRYTESMYQTLNEWPFARLDLICEVKTSNNCCSPHFHSLRTELYFPLSTWSSLHPFSLPTWDIWTQRTSLLCIAFLAVRRFALYLPLRLSPTKVPCIRRNMNMQQPILCLKLSL